MRPFAPVIFALLVAAIAAGQTSSTSVTVISLTTTLAAESGNNTSAAATFTSQTNGNAGAGNVSKLPVSSLLYAGSNTRVYAHFMPWFGGANHMNVGYSSNDATQVRRQVDDMMSRAIRGAIIDWYGPNFTRENNTTLMMKAEAELRGGAFEFAVMEDAGALGQCAHTAGCDLTTQMLSDIAYANSNYFGSPAYMRIAGRPVLFFFGEEQYAIDWTRARANAAGNPMFISRNNGGFTLVGTDGAFSWVNLYTDPLNMGFAYLDSFDATGLLHPTLQTFGSGYKGFNDTLAAWSANRIMSQQCGATWLDTMAETGKYYSPNNQLPALQMVTWNDYEEGTELETGVDGCVTLAATLSGSSLQWTITGSDSTLDHYTVFLSPDGIGLMPLGDVPLSSKSFDLSAVHLPAGNYQLFVKAVAKPSILNHMSAAVSYTVASQPPVAALSVTPVNGTAPLAVSASSTASSGSIASSTIDFGDGTVATGSTASHTYSAAGTYTVTATVKDSLGTTATATTTVTAAAAAPTALNVSASPATATVTSGQPGTFSISATPNAGSLTSAVTFTCANLPQFASCNFAPATVSGATVAASTTLTVGTSPTLAQNNIPGLRPGLPVTVFAGMPALGLIALLFADERFAKRNRKRALALLFAVLLVATLALTGCGGSSMTSPAAAPERPLHASTPAGTYNLTVTATSGTLQHSTTLTLTVQ